MNEEQLKAYLKEHLKIQVDVDTEPCYYDQPARVSVSVALFLGNEEIASSSDYHNV